MGRGTEAIWISGFLGGYPAGAQAVASAYHTERLRLEEANRLLWEIEGKGDARDRDAVLQALARHPENLDRMIRDLRSSETSPQDRGSLLDGLSVASFQDKTLHQRLWDLQEQDPALSDPILSRFLESQDPEAQQILVERLRAGQMEDALAPYLENLGVQTLRDNAATLRDMASNPKGSPQQRRGAYYALVKVDAPVAREAVLSGFAALPEQSRAELFECLIGRADAPMREKLLRLAEGDPSQDIKDLAKQWAP